MLVICAVCFFFFFKQKTAYEMRISDWSSDVCSSDLLDAGTAAAAEHVEIFLEWAQIWLGTTAAIALQIELHGLAGLHLLTIQLRRHGGLRAQAPQQQCGKCRIAQAVLHCC